MLTLVEAFASAGRRVSLVLGRNTGILAGMVPSQVRCIELGRASAAASIPLLARYIEADRPSILVSNSGITTLPRCLRLAYGAPAPELWSANTTLLRPSVVAVAQLDFGRFRTRIRRYCRWLMRLSLCQTALRARLSVYAAVPLTASKPCTTRPGRLSRPNWRVSQSQIAGSIAVLATP